MSSDAVGKYISEIGRYFEDKSSSEMSYRTAFQNYLEVIFPRAEKFHIQHDPKAEKGNKPDFIVLRDGVPLLYIEVKKVGEDLNKIERSAQAARYFGYTNLVISDYCEFRFYRNGERYGGDPIQLAHISAGVFIPQTNKGEYLERTLLDFMGSQREPIKNGKHLARIMGGKAQRIRDNVVAFLDSESPDKEELERMMRFMKDHLIANFEIADFADMYAQTLVYGLFAARYNDKTLNDFSRQEARSLVPKTNPFLQNFFDHISGASFPKRLEIIVDELCVVFAHADVRTLMEDYFKETDLFGVGHESPDPVIHFYEDFLREYDPAKKMEKGVFYTPLPVVRYIIKGIDIILKKEFGIENGLADSSKVERDVEVIGKKGTQKKVRQMVHRVQLLDFATGTGTFLNETIAHIFDSFKGNEGRWHVYAENDLIPRLHGFELMMASYTIAHLKLAMSLAKAGITSFKNRLGLYLTNTLEDAHVIPRQGNLFGFVDSIAQESILASEVKKDRPIMVVMGNPPYSGISQNKHYTDNDAYKVEPGGKVKLKERKHWLDDDYVKFIRFAEKMIEKNGEGIIGMITAHGYIDNATFRGMRWHLRQTFDAIYVLDLHGNSTKKETVPGGGKDENVFDIKTGVAIMFGVRTSRDGKKRGPGKIFKADLFGKRTEKFSQLSKSTIGSTVWHEIPADADRWEIEREGRSTYEEGFSVAELFPTSTTGIVTARDAVVIDTSKVNLLKRIEAFTEGGMTESELRHYLFPGKKDKTYKAGDTRGWKLMTAQQKIRNLDHEAVITKIAYRPFDDRYCYYHPDMVDWGRFELGTHFRNGNIALVAMRQATDDSAYNHVMVTNRLVDNRYMYSGKGITIEMPLYLYVGDKKVPNLNADIVLEIENAVGETEPEDLLDYVYASLSSPRYRKEYEIFLKKDFPRVPYPTDKTEFWRLVECGRKLRAAHIFDGHNSGSQKFPISGSNIVEKPSWRDKKIYINPTQYWDDISEDIWDFYIGGYQPLQKFLKDRSGTALSAEEFETYEKIINAIQKTIQITNEIDEKKD